MKATVPSYPWRRLIAGLVVALAFCVVSYFFFDRPVALWFKANLAGEWLRFFKAVTDLGLGGAWLIPSGIGMIVFRWRQVASRDAARAALWRMRANASTLLFVSVAASGLFVDLLKALIGRLRPNELFAHGDYGFAPLSIDWSMTSFPSGHGQTAFAAMTVLAAIWPRGRIAFLALATLIAASRVIVSVHYLSDVIMGAYFGAAGTILLVRLFRARGWEIRDETRDGPAATPSSTP
jgi:membrane-associated phospholipid phosphatase